MAKDKGEFQVFKRSNKPYYYVKTDTMIKRYGDHELQGEREIIRRALLDTFGDHLPII
ncbi:MAG: hypothetical protein FWG92_04960 [Leptospirales bacterium]|nr:hypothetical protein [Leptospirales bacterium]